jgi:DNA-binding MarR family transcriptional regulator
MEQRGLVTRERDPHDRRLVLVRLARPSEGLIREIVDHRRTRLPQILARMTDDEKAALLKGLRAIKRARAAVSTQSGHEAR